MQSTGVGYCSFDGCHKAVHAHRLCGGHYSQLLGGRALQALRPLATGSVSERVDAYTDRSGDCWLWTGGKTRSGYGRINIDGAMRMAHRVAFELANGPIPEGKTVDHRCHTLLCVRPDHLQLATPMEQSENRAGPTASNRSGVRGVYRSSNGRKWVVKVGHARRAHHGGTYATLAEAESAAIALRLALQTNNLLDQVPDPGLSRMIT